MEGTPGVNSYFLMSWSLFSVGQLLSPIYMASRPICTWTIHLVKKKKVFCIHLVLIKNEYIREACLLSVSCQKKKYRMWDPTRAGMAKRKPWYHQFSTLMPSLRQALFINSHHNPSFFYLAQIQFPNFSLHVL